MDLYIRSQDRKMVENFISIKISVDNEIILNNDYVFGSYETEKRALEVLDEIVAYKDNLDEANFLGMTESIFVSSIYTMPKE